MELNDFQLSLIAAGVAVVLLVWIYNVVQERRHRKAAEKVFRSNHPDVLLDGEEGVAPESAAAETTEAEGADQDWERKEPQFEVGEPTVRIEPVIGDDYEDDLPLEPQVASEPAQPKRDIPVLEAPELEAVTDPVFVDMPATDMPTPVLSPSQATVRPARQTLSALDDSAPDEALADPVVEVAIAVTFEQPQTLEAFWEPLRKLPARAAARLRCIGRSHRRWREIDGQDGQAYDEVQLLLQLADRQGPITEAELVPFVQAVEAAAALVGGQVAVPPVPEVLEHARALDEFCAAVDIQMAVHVVNRTGGEFVGSKLRGLLEAGGFKLKPDGLFHLPDDWGNSMLTLSNFGAAPFVADQIKTLTTHGVTFWLDVPRVNNGAAAFDRLVYSAKTLADAVDGVLVDDQRRPLGETVLANIRGKIDGIQKSMVKNQIPAGGRRALRLFR